MSDYAVFIVTHGRPDRQITYGTLRRQGYTGKVYFILDDQDKTIEQYRAKFGEAVVVFDKKAVAANVDFGDNSPDLRTVLIARNACHDIAVNLGLRYFLVMDDDYTRFGWMFNHKRQFASSRPNVVSLDKAFDTLWEFYKASGLLSLAVLQGGDMIGGAESTLAQKIFCHRKCMQTFFCSTDRPIRWVGRLNDDVNTYITAQQRGDGAMMSVNLIQVNQGVTQQNSGGMTEAYLDMGTYVKSFYSVMFAPSAMTVRNMGTKHHRLHHFTDWNAVAPLYVAERWKKNAEAPA